VDRASQGCFVIAEAGVNHNGDLDKARQLIDVAADAGADAVKFQTFRASALVDATAKQAAYQTANTGIEESQRAMLERLELSREAHQELMRHAQGRGILFLSTPFGEEDADFLHSLGVEMFKVGSGDLTNLPLLEHIAALGRPMIVSTGMAQLSEVAEAVEALARFCVPRLTLLHCVSSYPANDEDINLRAMDTLRTSFGLPVGYSDHSMGTAIAIAAVARGAQVLEKHVTLSRDLPGPDHKASLEPDELAAMVRAVRSVEAALGDGRKRPRAAESETAAVARRGLVFARDLPQGHVLEAADMVARRPETGLRPRMRGQLAGHRLTRAVEAGERVSLSAIE